MGMDLVELVMELEDEFEISIPDDVATELLTVGKTTDMVLGELRRRVGEAGVCATARSVYRLRRGLIARCGARRGDVRPGAAIGPLVALRHSRHWNELACGAGLHKEPATLFKPRFPPPEMPVREIIATRGSRSYRRFDGSLDEAAVEQRVLCIISQVVGVPAEKLRPEMRYVED